MWQDSRVLILKVHAPGMQVVKPRGLDVGRPRELTPHQLSHARELI
ncbi:MAG TPA: hypothetical protein VKB53_04625 [Gammaproteobacteria bacterium]|nr:hypothetical protein [Gammaproteobacteria bacterium]